jgi:leucine dehydrogenase
VSLGGEGDPSPFTAAGVYHALRAGLVELFGSDSLEGKAVAVQGCGNVGRNLIKLLVENGARVFAADVSREKARSVSGEFGAEPREPGEIYRTPCDVFAPCAVGAVLNDRTVPQLRCRIVAGAANNQLAEPRHGLRLHERGILYLPDYIVNAGGVLYLTHRLRGVPYARALEEPAGIYETVRRVLELAKSLGVSTSEAGDLLSARRPSREGPTPT